MVQSEFKKKGGSIEVCSKHSLNEESLAKIYTPGVADLCREIADSPELVFEKTIKHNTIAVISDGSAVLGLGNIGPGAALPVMEGKALLLKEFAGVDAFPLVLATQDTEEIIQTIKNIAPGLGGINLEDISAPRCFEIEQRLSEELDIPVFHDDQDGTAIVVLAGLYNALHVVGKNLDEVKIVVSGSGAAGVAITKLLKKAGAQEVLVVDSFGILSTDRTERMNPIKIELAEMTNTQSINGSLGDALVGADVFIGVSAPDILTAHDIKQMNEHPIVFALSNPVPEIMPDEALGAGAAVVATGRSDFANQINNVLVFPGLFRGVLDTHTKKIIDDHRIGIAKAISRLVKNPTSDNIIPSVFTPGLHAAVADVFKKNNE